MNSKRTFPRIVLVVTALSCLLAGRLAAQEIPVDAGATETISSPVVATGYVWKFNGDVVADQTASTFTYSPIRKDVGTHWLKLEATLPGGGKADYHWRLRVRIPLPTSTLNYYVATDGSDADPGTLAEPFATLEKARDVVRALPRPLPAGGVTVFIRGGTYRRTSTFNLSSSDSGTEAAPIFYKAYPGETPRFTSGTPIPASAFGPLDASMQSRVASGVTVSNIKQLDLSAFSFANDGPFPVRFNQNRLRNPYYAYAAPDGEIFELFFNGARAPLSRYPNDNLANRFATPCLKMDGVTQKYATTLNGEAIGGQFKYKAADAARIQRWITAANEGALWLQGFWRVPWEEYGMKVKSIDTAAGTFTMANGASMSLGYGNKYSAYEGSKTEPYWALNLLEEIDQPGEWSIDFIRNKLYFWPSSTIADGSVEISDFAQPLVKLTGVDHTILQGLTFDISLAQGVVVSGGANNLVLGCKFRRMGSYAVDLENGSSNGVLSCDMEDMAAGGVYLRGGDSSVTPRTSCNHFVVNNDMLNIANVVKIYAAGVDVGFGGQAGTGGGGGAKTCVGARVAHNRITNTHHVGILHGSFDKTIEYNNVENFCVTNNDMGGVYSFQSALQGGFDTIRFNQFTNKRFTWAEYLTSGYGGSGIQVDSRCEGSRMFGNIIETRRTGFSVNTGDNGQFFNNQIVNNAKAATSIGGTPAVFQTNFAALGVTTFGGAATGANKTYSTDPGILSRTTNDYRLKTASTVYTDLPLWQEIPVEMIGLYIDEIRTSAPTLKPVIDNPSGATNIAQFSATLNGQLDFPYINQDTTVRVYWGATDGGTTTGNWQSNTALGIKTRGKLAASVTGLAQQTTYYYRFHASNTAGTAWASATRSFTTAGPPSTKADNTNNLSLASSWTNNAVPAGGLGIWNSTVTGSNTTTIGTGLALLGIQVTNPGGDVTINPGTSGALTLGSGGIDLSTSARLLNIAAPIVLSGDQTWTTGTSGVANSTQITASGVISGAGELRIAGTAGRGVALTGSNTFTGGLVLDVTGRVLTGAISATATSSALGVGPLTINGGVIGTIGGFGLNQGIANSLIVVNNDFALEPAGRIMIAGAWDLGGAVRTVSCSRTTTSNNAIIAGGNTSWGLASVASVAPLVANGILRVTRADGASNFVSFRMQNSPVFIENAGLAIGSGVISVLGRRSYEHRCHQTCGTHRGKRRLLRSLRIGRHPQRHHLLAFRRWRGGQLQHQSNLRHRHPHDQRRRTRGHLRVLRPHCGFQPRPQHHRRLQSRQGQRGEIRRHHPDLRRLQHLHGHHNRERRHARCHRHHRQSFGSFGLQRRASYRHRLHRLAILIQRHGRAHRHAHLHQHALAQFLRPLRLESRRQQRCRCSADRRRKHHHHQRGDLESQLQRVRRQREFQRPVLVGPAQLSVDRRAKHHRKLHPWRDQRRQRGQRLHAARRVLGCQLGDQPDAPMVSLHAAGGMALSPLRHLHQHGRRRRLGRSRWRRVPEHRRIQRRHRPERSARLPRLPLDQNHRTRRPALDRHRQLAGRRAAPSASSTRIEFLTGIATTTASITAQNNLGTFTLNRLVLGGLNATGTTTFNLTGNPLNFVKQGSVLPSIDFAATGAGFTHDVALGITLSATTSIRRTGTGNMIISGPISGAGGLNVDAGTGTVLLTGSNSYSGVTTIEAGTLKIGNDGATGTFGTGAVVNNGTLRIERTGTILVPNEIGGSGSVIVSNPGSADVAVLSGSNSFTGGVTITGGARITNGNALGSGVKTISLSGATTSNLRLDGSGGPISLPATFTINSSNPNGTLINEAGDNSILGPVWLTIGAGGSRFISQAGTLTLVGAVKPNTSGRSLDLRGAGNGVISGGLSDGSPTATLSSLTKNEAGTWTLSGSNSYTGNTTVSGGTLAVTGSLTSAGALTVSSGATFSGNGTFGGTGTISGTLAPGLATFNSALSFVPNSVLVWKSTANTLTAAGRVNGTTVTGTSSARIDLVLNSPGSTTNFLHSFWRSSRSWTVLSAISMSGTFSLGNVSTDSGGRPALTYGGFSLQQSITGVTLNWTPAGGFPVIDEPAVSRVTPIASPVATPDIQHVLRVSVSASGGGNMAFAWSMTSGSGTATFANPAAADTTVTFSAAGRYVLRCAATNEVGSGFAEFIVDAAPAQSFTLLQGVDGYEQRATLIRADNTAWNSGARPQLLVGKASAALRAILSFDLNTVPRTWPASGVTLDLWSADATSGTVGVLNLHRLTRNFVEGTGNGDSSTSGTGTGATWATYNGTTAWTALGGDYETTVLSSVPGFSAAASGVQKTFGSSASFLSALNTALSGNSSLNLMLLSGTTEGGANNNYARFASDDHATEAWRPRLTVQFAHSLAPTVDPGTAPAATTGSNASLNGAVTAASASLWSVVSGPGTVFFGNSAQPATTAMFTHPGAYVLRLSAANAHGETSRTLAVNVTGSALTGLQTWRYQYFGTTQNSGSAADTFDGNGDGENNLMEFATGQNPNAATTKPGSLAKNGTNLEFTYTRSKAAMSDGVAFTVEWSDTLVAGSWSADGVNQTALVTGQGATDRVTATVPAGTGPRRFVRLKVTKP